MSKTSSDQKPLTDRQQKAIATVCRLIESATTMPALDEMAAAAHLSPFHFHRLFKRALGISPKAYWEAQRQQRLRTGLTESQTVTEAALEAGYNSGARFYATAAKTLGMKPTDYRSGGSGHVVYFALGQCSLGCLLVAATDRGVCAIALGDEPEVMLADLERRFPRADLRGGDADFDTLVAQVAGLIDQGDSSSELPLDIRGTAFQQRVWQALTEIPRGETRSYRQISEAIGQPRASRAVAAACGANPLAVAIPCHRVVRSDGGLSGYRWGVERKAELLRREKALAGNDPA
ncbi:MAG: bifunctional DNA-binding transcriptional regulator/O6-methylguanine-DNA methyltransferase Ada [Pseudomonadota bacterium]